MPLHQEQTYSCPLSVDLDPMAQKAHGGSLMHQRKDCPLRCEGLRIVRGNTKASAINGLQRSGIPSHA